MRLVVLALALSVLPLAARAEPESPPGIGFSEKRRPAAEEGRRWGDGKTGRGPQPIQEPARGPAYNVTHIVYASVIMLAMLAFTFWLIRRNRRQ